MDLKSTFRATQPAGSRSDFNLAQTSRVTLIIYHRDEMEAVSLERGSRVVVGRSEPADVVNAVRESNASDQAGILLLLNRQGDQRFVMVQPG